MAEAGHISAQMPHPLQCSRSMTGPTPCAMHASGQYTQQIWHVTVPCRTARQRSATMTGRALRQSPVLPASPAAGRDIEISWLRSRMLLAPYLLVHSKASRAAATFFSASFAEKTCSMAAPWSVLNDQQDSMSVRDAGWVQLYCRNNQEILDTLVQAYRIAESLYVPVMVCYDGFLLSHTMMPVELPDPDTVDAFLPPYHPLTVVDPDDPRNIGPVTLADPRPDAEGVARNGYMEFRALHHRALLGALETIERVDAEYGAATGRTWGGLLWEHRLDDADVVLIAAGSLGTQLTVAADELRDEGMNVGVLGIRSYRPFPAVAVRDALDGRSLALVFDKALSYGHEGPICSDIRSALQSRTGAPVVYGAICGLGGRDVSPADLADATRRAVADRAAGIVDREPDWINLHLEEDAR